MSGAGAASYDKPNSDIREVVKSCAREVSWIILRLRRTYTQDERNEAVSYDKPNSDIREVVKSCAREVSWDYPSTTADLRSG